MTHDEMIFPRLLILDILIFHTHSVTGLADVHSIEFIANLLTFNFETMSNIVNLRVVQLVSL